MLLRQSLSKTGNIFLLTAFSLIFLVGNVRADVAQMKIYKEAFPEEKPKCSACHTDQIPKKDTGKHELNAYGKKAMAEAAKPTAAIYKKIGKAPEAK